MGKPDYCKTMVLLGEGHTKPRYFRRHTVSVLLDRDGRVLRPMTYKEWREFQMRWASKVEKDNLSIKIVWVLEEVEV